MKALVDAFIRGQSQMMGHDLRKTFEPKHFVDRKPEMPRLDADSVKCRLTVCPRDCPIVDLCMDNNDGHF